MLFAFCNRSGFFSCFLKLAHPESGLKLTKVGAFCSVVNYFFARTNTFILPRFNLLSQLSKPNSASTVIAKNSQDPIHT